MVILISNTWLMGIEKRKVHRKFSCQIIPGYGLQEKQLEIK
jgi:hypothetical protein